MEKFANQPSALLKTRSTWRNTFCPFAQWSGLVLLVFVGLQLGCSGSGETENPGDPAQVKKSSDDSKSSESNQNAEKITLFIDFGEAKEGIRTETPWEKGLNAISVLEKATTKIASKHRGSGATGFLTSIEGVKNDLTSRKYWIYYVNGKKGTVGAGAYSLKPKDKVLWRFGSDDIE